MRRTPPLSLICMVLAALVAVGCATVPPDGEIDDIDEREVPSVEMPSVEPESASGSDDEALDDVATKAEEAEESEESEDEEATATGRDDDAEAVEVAAVARVRDLTPPRVVVEPAEAAVGEPVVVSVASAEDVPAGYDTVEIDFGDGYGQDTTRVFWSFGVKHVRVRVVAGERSAIRDVRVVVRGQAAAVLDAHEVQHHEQGDSTVSVRIDGEGDYDIIRVLEEGRLLYAGTRQEEYLLPVRFVGERTFTGTLSMDGSVVAELSPVSVTGLNAPPTPPAFDGDPMISARIGREVRFTLTAVDPNGNEILYEAQFLPRGAVFDTTTGEFRWTPGRNDLGLHLVHFRAYDLPFMTKRSFAQRGIVVQGG